MTDKIKIDWTSLMDSRASPGHDAYIVEQFDLDEPVKPYEPTPDEKERARKRRELEEAQNAPGRFDDDRRWCTDCRRLTESGRCTAPAAGLMVASRQYEPAQTMPRRCVAYLPKSIDPDQTPGDKRWPWLNDAT